MAEDSLSGGCMSHNIAPKGLLHKISCVGIEPNWICDYNGNPKLICELLSW